MSNRSDGPNSIASPTRRSPDGRTMSVPDPDNGAGAAVVADRQVFPRRGQSWGVWTEYGSDILGVMLRGVEVDVVSDIERHVQPDVCHRHQMGFDQVALGLVADQFDQPASHCGPGLGAQRHERVEAALGEHVCAVQVLHRCQRCEVEDEGPDGYADARILAVGREHPVRQGVCSERVILCDGYPRRCRHGPTP
jgi:hypothetical protein